MPIRNWRELQSLVKNKQSGLDVDTTGKSWLEGWDPASPEANEDYKKRLDAAVRKGFSEKSRMLDAAVGQQAIVGDDTDLTDLALEVGYGERKKDYDTPLRDFVNNPQDERAHQQSQFGKFLNGTVKLIPYAGTTFLDNTVGLLTGLANVGIDALNGGEFKPTDSFINNFFSEWMQGVRDWSEEKLPNYRTVQETEDEDKWWKHLNGNFWGDIFMKNLGFTIGAGAAGAVYAKGFQALQGKTMNKAYKAAVAAAAGDADAEAAFQKVLQGGRMQDAKKIYDTFESVQNSFKRLGWESMLVGGLGGAMGESRVEAMNAAKEFHDDYYNRASEWYEREKVTLTQDIMDNYMEDKPVYDGYGNIIGSKPGLSDEGYTLLENGIAELQDRYREKLSVIDNESEALANTTFWLNMPLLTISNAIFFGRMLSGGYKSQAKTKVRGKFGNYKQAGSVGKAIGLGVKNSISEGMEELSQKMISEGTKDIAGYNTATFHNGKYDENAIKDVSSWLASMLNTAGEVLYDPTSWEEFAVGALTGAIGMPSNGGWTGGIYGGIKEGLNERQESRDLANKLNETISSPEFRDRWESLVRHQHYENIKDIALNSKVNGDGPTITDANGNEVGKEFAWHTANDAQLISDVMMFADAGRLDELEAYADAFGRINEKDIPNINSLISNDEDKEFKNKSTESKLKWLHDRADEVKRTIRQYRQFFDSVDFLSLGTSDPEAIKELIFTQSQLKNFEDRYNILLDDVIKEIKPRLVELSQERGEMDKYTPRALQAQKLLESEDNLRRIFGGFASDIHGTEGDSAVIFEMLDNEKQARILDTLDSWGTFTGKLEVRQKVKDLQELVRSRQKYYSKLFDPKHRQKFQSSSVSGDKVVQELQSDARKKKVDAMMLTLDQANSLAEYSTAFDSLEDTDKETFDMLQNAISANPKLKKYEDTIQSGDEFLDAIGTSLEERRASNTDDALNEAYDEAGNALNMLSLGEAFPLMQTEDDIDVALAKALLPKVGGEAQKILRSIIAEKLGDAAQANGLGVIEGTGGTVNPGEGEGEGNGGGEGNVSQYDRIGELIDKISDFNDTDLNKFAEGDFSDYPGLTDQQMFELSGKARGKIDDLKAQSGVIPTRDGGPEQFPEELPDDDPKKIQAHNDFVSMDTGSISGSRFSVYHPGELRKGRVKRFQSGNPGTQATIDWLVKHKVQDFIDSGALAELEKKYKDNNDGKKLPVYFLANPHYVENNLPNNPFVVQYTDKKDNKKKLAPSVMLAVEMNDENRGYLESYENAGVYSNDTMLEVDGMKYQVIGELWNPTEKELADKEKKGEREKYERVKEESQRIWGHAVGNSILPHYQNDLKNESSAAFTDEGRWYVARIHPFPDIEETDIHKPDYTTGDRMFTTLNYVMSGRNDTKALDSDSYKKIPIRDALVDYEKYGKEYFFAIPTDRKGFVTTEDAPPFPPSISARPGSLWMATQEANGAWGWTCLTIARTDEFDFEGNQDTVLMKKFDSAMKIIFEPIDTGLNKQEFTLESVKRIKASNTLHDLFYLGIGNTFHFAFDSLGPVLYVGGVECRDRRSVIEALRTGKYRFQINAEDLNDMNRMYMFIDAGVLRSEMRSFIRRGASLGVNFMEDKDAEGKQVTVHVKDSTLPIARTAGSDIAGVLLSNTGGVSNIRIGEAGYRINPDGSVTSMSSRFGTADRVDDPLIVAQVKAIGELLVLGGEPDANWPGKHYFVSNPGYQYTDLFEREINGIIVHMGKRGENGAVMPIYNDEEWGAIMSVAKPVTNSYKSTESETPPPTQRELEKLYDEKMAEEAGGKAVEKEPQKKTKRSRLAAAKGKIAPESKTVQQDDQDAAKKEEQDDCGPLDL